MLSIVVAHVQSMMYDWGEANYRMSGQAMVLTAIPDPTGGAPTAERSAQINAELRGVLEGTTAVVVLDAQDGDGPRLGLYDPMGRFSEMQVASGRRFQATDFNGAQASAMVRSDSYLVGREREYLPEAMEVIGYFDPASVPFRSEYVYTLFTQQNVHGSYYVDAEDPEVAANVESALTRGGYLVDTAPVDSNVWTILQGKPLSYAYGTSLLLVYGSGLLLSLNWVAANRRRYRIARYYGAHPVSFAWRSLRLLAFAVVVDGTVGAVSGYLLLQRLGTLSVLPRLPDLGVITLAHCLVWCGLFTAAVMVQTASWRRE